MGSAVSAQVTNILQNYELLTFFFFICLNGIGLILWTGALAQGNWGPEKIMEGGRVFC